MTHTDTPEAPNPTRDDVQALAAAWVDAEKAATAAAFTAESAREQGEPQATAEEAGDAFTAALDGFALAQVQRGRVLAERDAAETDRLRRLGLVANPDRAGRCPASFTGAAPLVDALVSDAIDSRDELTDDDLDDAAPIPYRPAVSRADAVVDAINTLALAWGLDTDGTPDGALRVVTELLAGGRR